MSVEGPGQELAHRQNCMHNLGSAKNIFPHFSYFRPLFRERERLTVQS